MRTIVTIALVLLAFGSEGQLQDDEFNHWVSLAPDAIVHHEGPRNACSTCNPVCWSKDWINADTTAYKSYSDSTGDYLIGYQYNSALDRIRSNTGGPHYEAVITVFEIVAGDTVQVFQPLRGVFVEGDCVCYHPEKTVHRYKELQKAEQ